MELETAILAARCALLAWVFCEVLCQPGELLDWWPPLVQRVLPSWLRRLENPLFACAKCQAGMLTLASCLFLGFPWLECLLGPALAILLAQLVGRVAS